MKKKKYAAIFCIMLIFFIPQGCRKPGIGSKDVEEDAAKEKMTLMCISSMDQEILDDAVEEFNRTNGYQVEIECEYFCNEEYKSELARRMAVNEEPDLFFSWQSGFLKVYADRGKVLNLDSYLSQDPFWTEVLEEDDFEGVSFHGNVYGIPLTKCITVVYYNKEIFEKNQIEIPRTYQEFMDICGRLKQEGITPLYLGSTPWSAGLLFLEILRGTCGKELMQYNSFEEIPWTSKPYQEAAKKLQELYQAGYIPEDFLETGDGKLDVSEAAMQVAGNWFVPWKEDKYGAFLFPPVREENASIATGGGDRSFAIAAKCSHPEAAYSFLKLYSSEKYQSRVLYEESNIPCRKLEIEADKANPLLMECMDLMGQAQGFCRYIDVHYGMEFGDLFNESAQAILSGRDYGEILEGMEQYTLGGRH